MTNSAKHYVTQAIALTNEAHAIKDAWGPGGTYRKITTALAAGATGRRFVPPGSVRCVVDSVGRCTPGQCGLWRQNHHGGDGLKIRQPVGQRAHGVLAVALGCSGLADHRGQLTLGHTQRLSGEGQQVRGERYAIGQQTQWLGPVLLCGRGWAGLRWGW